MIKAHKIRLHPTAEQLVYLSKAAGTSRFVWNWALAEWNRQYATYAAIKEGRACRWPQDAEPLSRPSPSKSSLMPFGGYTFLGPGT